MNQVIYPAYPAYRVHPVNYLGIFSIQQKSNSLDMMQNIEQPVVDGFQNPAHPGDCQ